MRPFRVATCALAAALLGVSSAAPQFNTVLSVLGIDLWPDYDRAGVLVIYRATLAPAVSLPTRLVFRVPAAAGIPSAVAERSADGQLLNLPYERTVDGETAAIEFTTSRPVVQLEYYDPAITRDGAKRSFAFTWPGDFEVQDFSISLQQPHLAQDFTTVPVVTSSAAAADGLMYHTLSRAGVKAGETVEVQVSYEKVSNQLSVETMTPAAAPTPAPATEDAAGSDNRTVLVVLAAMFVCAAAVVVGLMVRTRQQAGPAPRSTPPPRKARSRPPGGKATRFCTQCGAGVDVAGGDRFCKRCGAALKA
jgi:hypothetical protein